ncbi:MAG: hypothetical protein OES13_05795 [Acidimicrobiia bacterium]|nr:hypothetical protein [Acidimicrobiia bacterium]
MFRREEVDHLYYLHMSSGPGDGVALARASDGVHYEEHGAVIDKDPQAAWLGSGAVLREGQMLAMNFSEMVDDVQRIHTATSQDGVVWTRTSSVSHPDRTWYNDMPTGRWDCIYPIERGGGGFWGYLTANPWTTDDRNDGLTYRSVGMVVSDDGVAWRAVAPPVIDWGSWEPSSFVRHTEVSSAAWIDDRLYLLLCSFGFRGDAGGTYTFIGDRPEGPFRPDAAVFSLLSSRPPLATYFARFYRRDGELLVHHHAIDHEHQRWLSPLKATHVDGQGSLSLRYWQGNEALKGLEQSIDLASACAVTPSTRLDPSSPSPLQVESPLHGIGIVMLGHHFDASSGVVVEADVVARPPASGWGGAGFYLETGAEHGVLMLPQTHGQTVFGVVDLDTLDRHPTDFGRADTIERGIEAHAEHRLRLLVRGGLAELYVDESLIQCFSLDQDWTGKFGLVVEAATLEVSDVRAWGMSL